MTDEISDSSIPRVSEAELRQSLPQKDPEVKPKDPNQPEDPTKRLTHEGVDSAQKESDHDADSIDSEGQDLTESDIVRHSERLRTEISSAVLSIPEAKAAYDKSKEKDPDSPWGVRFGFEREGLAYNVRLGKDNRAVDVNVQGDSVDFGSDEERGKYIHEYNIKIGKESITAIVDTSGMNTDITVHDTYINSENAIREADHISSLFQEK